MQPLGVLSDEDRELILAVTRDYIESWLDGDADRMAACLHGELVKRALLHRGDGPPGVDTMSRDDMVRETGEGLGRRLERPYEIDILDTFEDIATVRLLSSAYVDYLHVARFGDRWQLLNVLWKRRPDA
jgi:hypothetical protein